MKRISLILAAAALVLGLSQCKKQEQEQSAPAATGETVAITLEVKAPSGSKIDVNTANGEVTFEQGDVVYVINGQKFVGTLTYNGSTFKGNLEGAQLNLSLGFCFLGNRTPEETLVPGTSTKATIDISDQTSGKLPVISYGVSNEKFTGPGLYTAYFLNKAALVEIDMQTPLSPNHNLCITGVNGKVEVDATSAALRFNYSTANAETLKVKCTGDSKVYAILLPQAAQAEGAEGTAYVEDLYGNKLWEGKRPATEAIAANDYLKMSVNGVDVVPSGALRGKFSVSDTTQVYFSQGNLQYTKTTGTWSFMTNQYGTVETLNQNVGTNYANQDIVSLFGWGTGNNPTNMSMNNADYPAFNDWGVAAANNIGNDWRTLTDEEWKYVFNTRSGIRYAKATVNNVSGVILLPDDWSASTYTLSSTNTANASCGSNTISDTDWRTLEDAGAVFLPIAGNRNGATVGSVGGGYYWSASPHAGTNAYNVYFTDGSLNPGNYFSRYLGLSVRLVQDVN